MFNTFALFIFGALSGFMPFYNTIGWWFRWMSWVSFTSYCYEGMVLNALYNRDIFLATIPTATGFTTIGSVPGSLYLSLLSIPRENWGTITRMLFVFALFFDGVSLLFAYQNTRWYADKTRLPRKTCRGYLDDNDNDNDKSNIDIDNDNCNIDIDYDNDNDRKYSFCSTGHRRNAGEEGFTTSENPLKI
eukprot:Pgem_evm1s6945